MTSAQVQSTVDYSLAGRQAALDDIVGRAQDCRLDDEQLGRVADIMATLPPDYLATRTYSNLNLRPTEFPSQTLVQNDRDTIQYAFVTGSQGFFIWVRDAAGHATPWDITVEGVKYRGASGLFACHMRALRRGLNILDPAVLIRLTTQDLEEYYRDEETGRTTLQHLEGRLAKFHETGRVLLERFGGHFVQLLKEADGWLYRTDDRGVIQALVKNFPDCYGDWPFAKLPIVIARGLYQRRGATVPTTEEFNEITRFRDPERFDCGADYYRPFFLMRVGVLQISDRLRDRLAQEVLVEADSTWEHEYRAMTIRACEQLAEVSGTPPFNAEAETWETAFHRCRRCVPGIAETELACPYARVCRAYTRDPELLRIRWPLTYTLRH